MYHIAAMLYVCYSPWFSIWSVPLIGCSLILLVDSNSFSTHLLLAAVWLLFNNCSYFTSCLFVKHYLVIVQWCYYYYLIEDVIVIVAFPAKSWKRGFFVFTGTICCRFQCCSSSVFSSLVKFGGVHSSPLLANHSLSKLSETFWQNDSKGGENPKHFNVGKILRWIALCPE